MEQKKIKTNDLNLYYGENHALKHISMEIRANAVTAFIGPSGCGKSTFLRCLNRMNDLIENVRIEGTILLDGENIMIPQSIRRCCAKKSVWYFSSRIRFR